MTTFNRLFSTLAARIAPHNTIQEADIPLFGKICLIPPHPSSNKSNHQLWIDTFLLCNSDYYLLGYFTIELRSDIVRLNQFIARKFRDSLLLLCTSVCIFPSILYLPSSKHSTNKSKYLVALLGELGFVINKYVFGHGIFKGVITQVLPLKTNKKIN